MTHKRLINACRKLGVKQETGWQILTRVHTVRLDNKYLSWIESNGKAEQVFFSSKNNVLGTNVKSIKQAVALLSGEQ